MIEDDAVRKEVFLLSDDALAFAIREIAKLARQDETAWRSWDGYSDPRVERFLEEHPPPAVSK